MDAGHAEGAGGARGDVSTALHRPRSPRAAAKTVKAGASVRPVAVGIPFALALFAVASAPPTAARAQETIASDRPGIGSGSFALSSGLQVETGLQLSSSEAADAYSVGQALVRIGTPALELELFANSFVIQRGKTVPEADTEGFQDVGVGVKVPVLRGGQGPALSLQGIVTAPSGAAGFTADAWVSAVNALADIPLGGRAGIGVNLGWQGGDGVTDATSVIATPALSLGGGFGVFAGWAGSFSSDGDAHFAEGGLTYLPTPDIQLDLNGGRDVERGDWFLGVGLATRWGS